MTKLVHAFRVSLMALKHTSAKKPCASSLHVSLVFFGYRSGIPNPFLDMIGLEKYAHEAAGALHCTSVNSCLSLGTQNAQRRHQPFLDFMLQKVFVDVHPRKISSSDYYSPDSLPVAMALREAAQILSVKTGSLLFAVSFF